jgi:hypothetical protein
MAADPAEVKPFNTYRQILIELLPCAAAHLDVASVRGKLQNGRQLLSTGGIRMKPISAFFAVALTAAAAALPSAAAEDTSPEQEPILVRVAVVNFDPRMPSHGNQRLSSLFDFNDPRELSEGYISDIRKSSHGLVRYRIVRWRTLDEFPPKEDGFVYDPEAYAEAWEAGGGFHEPDVADYPRMIEEYGLASYVREDVADEIWIFGGPYFGFYEASMAGPDAFFVNGGVYGDVEAPKPFVIMGFNYERGVAEMVHDLVHRTEFTMKRVYGGWNMRNPQTPWDQFTQNAFDSPDALAAVGTCHHPPNAQKDYDYANARTVLSNADEWLQYPATSDTAKPVNRETWGGPDYQRGYLNWWLERLPHAPGTAGDGRLHNWWRYVFQFEQFDASGRPPKPGENVQPAEEADAG